MNHGIVQAQAGNWMLRCSRRALAALSLLCALCGAGGPARAASDADLIAYWKQEWPRTDFTRHTVPLQEIQSGGPPKDGIPAIDRPRFESVAAAARWIDVREPVIALEIGGNAKAYPLSILIWHEIVNDRLADTAIAVTFCPLCNASIVFERRVAGAEVDFGTTGKLRYSDLVMYDRQSETWWQQFNGSGIIGRHAGVALRKIESQIVAFGDFSAAWPDGRVLSRTTGFERPYGRNPYAGYDDIDQSPFLLTTPPDERLPPMERVLSVSAHGVHRVYPFSALARTPVLNDVVGGEPVLRVHVQPGSDVAITAEATLGMSSIRLADGTTIKASPAGNPPVIVGAGAGRLAVTSRLGSLVVSVA